MDSLFLLWKKLALSNSTSGADGSNTPESLLEGCINNHTVTQVSVVCSSAEGQVLGEKTKWEKATKINIWLLCHDSGSHEHKKQKMNNNV